MCLRTDGACSCICVAVSHLFRWILFSSSVLNLNLKKKHFWKAHSFPRCNKIPPSDQEVVRGGGKNTQMSELQGSGTQVGGW